MLVVMMLVTSDRGEGKYGLSRCGLIVMLCCADVSCSNTQRRGEREKEDTGEEDEERRTEGSLLSQ